MEELVMELFGGVYKNRRVLLTGHTGFKGSWLALWLQNMGAEVRGVALAPEYADSHWELLKLDLSEDIIDIRDFDSLHGAVQSFQPEIIFHLAAQALVRRSYRDTLGTWGTNVMGVVNVLEAARRVKSVRSIVVVTTDKCYENREWLWGYREVDRLGGHDPYSASKAGAELVADSFRKSFFSIPEAPLVATARAGNVIGGGDWSEDRIIPDLMRSVSSGQVLEIRSPNSTRPWQHVLDPLCGYLLLAQKLFTGQREFAEAWNFGPDSGSNRQVIEMLSCMRSYWSDINWMVTDTGQLHEAQLLHLDSTKARHKLGWYPVWGWAESLRHTAEWYQHYARTGNLLSRQQLSVYCDALSRKQGA